MPLDRKTLLDAVREAKTQSGEREFNQTIEFILDIKEIDMKSPEGKIQAVIDLPHATGKQNKICVVASGELALKARQAKADAVLEKSDLEAYAGNKKQLRKLANAYDVFLSEAPLMPLVGRILGPALGPRGKLPVPVPPNADIAPLITKHRKTVVVKMRNQPIIQCAVGTADMKEEQIVDNIQAVLRLVEGKLKRGLKNVKLAFVKTSMGKPVEIKP
jgi:large subunit ribosomal protein L1